MKVHWLNAEMTEARLVRGWLWKEEATVRRISEDEWRAQSGSRWWRHVPSGRTCEESSTVEHERVRAIEERKGRDWQPVRSLPPAKVVGK